MKWRELAARQDGVITRQQLRGHGLSASAIGRMSTESVLVRRAQGVYLVGGAPMTFRVQLWVAVLATDGVLSYQTAGQLWGVLDGGDHRVHVTVPPSRRVIAPRGVSTHHAVPGRIRIVSESPMTSRPDTVLDLLACLSRADADRLADRALQRGWLTRPQLVRAVTDRTGRTGTPQLRRLAEQTADGAAAQSERVLHRILSAAGITGWRANHPVWSNGELVGVVDVALPGRAIAIEVDGWAFHSDVDRFRRDRDKQNRLTALGWTVLRFTWADLVERPGYVAAAVRHQVLAAS